MTDYHPRRVPLCLGGVPAPPTLQRIDPTVPDPFSTHRRFAATGHPFDRRRFLRLGAGVATALVVPWSRAIAQGSGAVGSEPPASQPPFPPGLLRLFTSPDHWDPAVLVALAAQQGIEVRVTPLTDDAAAFAAVSDGSVVADLVSGDGLWIPAYHAAGLTTPIDLARVSVAEELYAVARTMDLLETPEGLLGYPWSWSPLQVVYDPARVASAPDSWDVLVDPANRGRVVIEAQQVDLVLCAARATGASDPLDMTDAELAAVTEWLTRLKPNIRRITRDRGDAIAALASGECTLAISSLGAPDLVKDANGPEMVAFVPKEGTIGSIEAEMLLDHAPNGVRVPAYLDAAVSAEACAAAFLEDGRPLFNERAYKLLVDFRTRRPRRPLPVRPTGGGPGDDAHGTRCAPRCLPRGRAGRVRRRMNGLAATSWGKGRVDLFWIGTDGALWTRHWDLGGWSADLSLGGTPATTPTVVSWGVGQMEVFAVFPDGQLWERYFDGSDWHAWESLGGELATEPTPTCSSWGPERLDVFAQGLDGLVWHRWWEGTRWVDWERLPARV